ncbi:MAG: transcription termination/antitermination protein NusG [Clostridia bacterium]|nr:transcription termination/antitermination protein NusG [Clostridia bacterium]
MDTEAKWYVLHTFTGYENLAKDNLEKVVEKNSLQDRIFEVTIPMEDVIEEKNGKRKLVQHKMLPCYILIKMIYGDDLWHTITRTRGVTGFVGPKGRPLELNDDEIRNLKLEQIKVDIDLSIGDKVEIIDGPLKGFIGDVVRVDPALQKCKVNVSMFERITPVDLEYMQIKKI